LPARKISAQDDKYRQDALVAAQAAIDKKGIEPVLIDLTQSDSYTDYMLIVSAQADRAVRAVADGVVESMQQRGARLIGAEGLREGRWALLDFGDVVVHVFEHPLREFYDLEGMWFDAPRIPLQIPADQRIDAQSPYRFDEDDDAPPARL
jgi:ribosome-associated protein